MSSKKIKKRKKIKKMIIRDPDLFLDSVWAEMTAKNIRLDKKRKRDYVV